MECKNKEKIFELYLDPNLPAEEIEQLKAHVSSCDSCREELQREEQLNLAFSNLKKENIHISDSFTSKTMSAILSSKKAPAENQPITMERLKAFFQSRLFRYFSVPSFAVIILLIILFPSSDSPQAGTGVDGKLAVSKPVEQSLSRDTHPASPAILETRAGQILISQSESYNWKQVNVPRQDVNYGNELDLVENASALLKYSNGSLVSLSESARIKVLASMLYMQKGKAWFKINPTGTTYKIRTPSAIIGVLGTVFMVSYDSEKGTTVYVKSGKVSVENSNSTKILTSGQFVFVKSKSDPFVVMTRKKKDPEATAKNPVPVEGDSNPANKDNPVVNDSPDAEWDINSSFGTKSLE